MIKQKIEDARNDQRQMEAYLNEMQWLLNFSIFCDY